LSVPFIFGLDVLNNPQLLTDFSNNESVSALKFMQFLHSLGIFVFPVLMYAYLASADYKKYLVIDGLPKLSFVLFTALIMVVSFPLINLLVEMNEGMNLPDFLHSVEAWMKQKELNAKIITESFMRMDDFSSFVINILIVGIIPAFGEELLFRGLIQNKISRSLKNHHVGIWVAAFLFSAMHLQFFGFLPRFLLGAVFGYLYLWSGSLWVPILAHLINNAGAVTLQYIFGNDFMENNMDSFGTEAGDVFYVTMSLVMISTLLYLFWKRRMTISP
jgi:membrane protease YdiL (CAAX protease family)